jgi:hypothetical protein
VEFEFSHDFDVSLDALELAVLSPELSGRLRERLPHIEIVGVHSHDLRGDTLERVSRYRANVPIPRFARNVVRPEMCAWEERSLYDLRAHESTWSIVPDVRREWQKYFTAKGSYRLISLGDARTRRVVKGELELKVPFFRERAEKMILGEVKKTFEAEAESLRELAILT